MKKVEVKTMANDRVQIEQAIEKLDPILKKILRVIEKQTVKLDEFHECSLVWSIARFEILYLAKSNPDLLDLYMNDLLTELELLDKVETQQKQSNGSGGE